MSNLVETPGAIIITEAEPATFGIRFFHYARTASSLGPCRISCVALLGLGLSLEPRELLLQERDDLGAVGGIGDVVAAAWLVAGTAYDRPRRGTGRKSPQTFGTPPTRSIFDARLKHTPPFVGWRVIETALGE